jgi:hypothetical protein
MTAANTFINDQLGDGAGPRLAIFQRDTATKSMNGATRAWGELGKIKVTWSRARVRTTYRSP